MKTPSLSHLSRKDYIDVYEPSEDTFLLLDGLEKDLGYIMDTIKPSICMEVGVGSGTVLTFLSTLIGDKRPCMMIGTDINIKAAQIAQSTAQHNSQFYRMDIVCTDLTTALNFKEKSIDLLVFNPPYVVTPSEEVGMNGIMASWAGGLHGMEVTNRLLPLVKYLISDNGAFYLVVIPENNPDEICKALREDGFGMECVLNQKRRNENLSILRFTRLIDNNVK